jgi:hypothetical protein
MSRSQSASAGSVQDYRYAWDVAGNLESRSDLLQDVTERFTFRARAPHRRANTARPHVAEGRP